VGWKTWTLGPACRSWLRTCRSARRGETGSCAAAPVGVPGGLDVGRRALRGVRFRSNTVALCRPSRPPITTRLRLARAPPAQIGDKRRAVGVLRPSTFLRRLPAQAREVVVAALIDAQTARVLVLERERGRPLVVGRRPAGGWPRPALHQEGRRAPRYLGRRLFRQARSSATSGAGTAQAG